MRGVYDGCTNALYEHGTNTTMQKLECRCLRTPDETVAQHF